MEKFKSLGNRTSLSKTVEAQIEEAIRTRKFQPGDRLPTEQELCVQFGVSRTVVREAAHMLHAKGLISVEKGRGMYVRKVTGESAAGPMNRYLQMHFQRSYVMDIVRARQILEPAIAELAAVNRSEEDLQRLEADIEALRKAEGDHKGLSDLDTQFHIDLAKASGNSLMPLLLDPIHRLIPEIKTSIYAAVKDAKESAVKWHAEIFDAIRRRDAVSARRAMDEHLKIAEAHAERLLNGQSRKSPAG